MAVSSSAVFTFSKPQAQSGRRPEIVLQTGISSPQTQLRFSPDGRLLASIDGMTGNGIKVWEVSTGRLLRQFEIGNASMGSNAITRPFRFSADGQTLTVLAGGR